MTRASLRKSIPKKRQRVSVQPSENREEESPWLLLWPYTLEGQNTNPHYHYCGEQTLDGCFRRVSVESDESEEQTESLSIKTWQDISPQEGETSLVSVHFCIPFQGLLGMNFYTYSGDVVLPYCLAKALHYLAVNHLLAAKILTSCLNEEALNYSYLSGLKIEFYFLDKLFLHAPSSPTEYRKLSVFTHVNILMSWLHPSLSVYALHSIDGPESYSNLDLSWFNQVCQKYQRERLESFYNSGESSQLTLVERHLRVTLRPYQRKAVSWMLYREGNHSSCIKEKDSNPLWFPVVSNNLERSISFYYNPCTGQVSKHNFEPFEDIQGGILADEMGLGKTVEVLALIMMTLASKRELTPAEKQERVFWGSDSKVVLSRNKADVVTENVVDEGLSFVTSVQFIDRCSECQELVLNDDSVPKDFRSLFVRCDECGKIEHAWCANYRFERAIRVLLESPHLCYQCEADYKLQNVLKSHATLIVCPSSILRQWEEEIERNVATEIHHFTYRGMKESGYIAARTLAEMDIVLTTYEALRNDLNRVDLGSGPSLRYAKVFRAVPTPLCRIDWFRICLDEAQMVEGGSCGAADMAQCLKGIHRWCVTGTPIQKDMSDFYGLVRFLQVAPFDDHFWWNHFVWRPARLGRDDNLKRLVGRLLWRNTKNIVRDELKLPPQSTMKIVLSFGPIERHFYERQYELCAEEAARLVRSRASLQDGMNTLDNISKKYITDEKLVSRLLRLRQACCHPQVGSDGIRVLQKSTMTMQEVLEALVQRRTVEVAEAERSYVASMNGLASLYILQNDLPKAVGIYRSVLRFAKENEEHVTMDSLQRLHILHNLTQVLDAIDLKIKDSSLECKEENLSYYKAVGRTLEESEYANEIRELEQRYTCEKVAKLSKAKASYEASKLTCENIIARRAKVPWWMEALNQVVANNKSLQDQIMEQIRSQLLYTSQGVFTETSMASRFHNLTGLQYVLLNELEKRDQYRTQLLETLEDLPGARTPTTEEVLASGNCKYCRIEGNGPACSHCLAKEKFSTYERSLFLVRIRSIGKKSNASHGRYGVISEGEEGARLQSEVEKILKIIKSCIRRHYRKKFSWLTDMERHFEEVEALKEEFRECHVYFESQHDLLSALDELEMAKMRISLKVSKQEQKGRNADSYQISQNQIGSFFMQFEHDKRIAEVEFQHKRSQLVFLKRLRADQESSNQEGREDALGSQPCPVCWRELEAQIVILPCGHRFCAECISRIVQQRISEHFEVQRKSQLEQHISCPTCRINVVTNELCYIERNNYDESCIRSLKRVLSSEEDMKEMETSLTTQQLSSFWNAVQGNSLRDSFGTKIAAVVIYLRMIIEENSDAKCILFSEWNDVLEIVSRALEESNIVFIRTEQKRGKSFETVLEKFRTDPNIRVLLLPVRSGSNGLNITEATHVFLIEPLLTDSLEAQAVSRIHRIGQEKPTFVHRFLIEDTIEEKIDELRRKKRTRSTEDFDKEVKVRGTKDTSREQELTVQDLCVLFPSNQ